jgi:hypothetical protein
MAYTPILIKNEKLTAIIPYVSKKPTITEINNIIKATINLITCLVDSFPKAALTIVHASDNPFSINPLD